MTDNTAEVVVTARYDDQASQGIERLRADISALGTDAKNLAPLEESLTRTSDALTSFRDQYAVAMDDIAEITRKSLEHFVAGSYMATTRALTAMITGAKNGAKEFGKAMQMLSAQAVLAIGQQAAVKAVFAMAEFFLFKDPTSLVAAKLYAAVAAMAMVAGAGLTSAVQGGSGSSGSSGGGSGGSGKKRKSDDEEKGGDQFVVNVHVEGHVVDSQAFVEDVVAPALAEAVGRGAASKSKYNIVTVRD